MFIRRKNKNGFTLVELLIVIAIIGILSSVSMISLEQARAKARDARRLSDVAQARRAVELYFAEYGQYPNINCHDLAGFAGCNSIQYPNVGYSSWIRDLTDNMNIRLPDDPINMANGLDYNNYTYTGTTHLYILTRADSLSSDFANYYYILFRLESQDQIDTCEGQPWGPSWSCMGGGNLP